jgi:hypothetical protein
MVIICVPSGKKCCAAGMQSRVFAAPHNLVSGPNENAQTAGSAGFGSIFLRLYLSGSILVCWASQLSWRKQNGHTNPNLVHNHSQSSPPPPPPPVPIITAENPNTAITPNSEPRQRRSLRREQGQQRDDEEGSHVRAPRHRTVSDKMRGGGRNLLRCRARVSRPRGRDWLSLLFFSLATCFVGFLGCRSARWADGGRGDGRGGNRVPCIMCLQACVVWLGSPVPALMI